MLFAHDHRFLRGAGGEVYTATSFAASGWARYLDHFDELRVIGRDGGPVPEGAVLARSDTSGVTFDFFESLSSIRALVAPPAEAIARMRESVRKSDAVVARLPSEIGMLAASEARRQGKSYAIEMVGCAWDGWFNHGSFAARLYAPLLYCRTRSAVRHAPQVLYVTSNWLQARYPTNGFAVSASNVEILPIDPHSHTRREQRLQQILEGHPPILGTIATLRVKTKGIQTAIEALSILRSEGTDLTYRILGPGDPAPWKQLAATAGVSDLVHFDGTRSAGRGVCDWLGEIDIYLQPSFQEGLPRATIEAMSRGAACIGSTCGGLPELLPPDRLHEPGDAPGLAERIRWLASSPERIVKASRDDLDQSTEYAPDQLRARRSEFYARLRDKALRNRATG